jgi:type III secretory pathway component EscS
MACTNHSTVIGLALCFVQQLTSAVGGRSRTLSLMVLLLSTRTTLLETSTLVSKQALTRTYALTRTHTYRYT